MYKKFVNFNNSMLLSKPPEGPNFWHQTEGFKNVYDLETIAILEILCSLWLKIMLNTSF